MKRAMSLNWLQPTDSFPANRGCSESRRWAYRWDW